MKTKRRVMASLGCLLLVTSLGCDVSSDSSNTPSTTPQTVRVDGSSTVYPITEAVAEEFGSFDPTVRVTVGFSGTGGGFKKFTAGEIDICDASRRIKENEQKALAEAGIEYIEMEIAYDGLAVLVNKENDWVDCLTVEQLKSIWKPDSTISKWSDIDSSWPKEEIKLYGPGADSGTFDYFTEVIVGESKASRSDFTASEDDNVLVTGIAADKYSLGYFGFAYYAENRERLKLLGVDSGEGCVTPSAETVLSNAYQPLSRPLFIYVRKSAIVRPEVSRFVTFYLDNAAQLSAEVGYVPVSEQIREKNMAALSE